MHPTLATLLAAADGGAAAAGRRAVLALRTELRTAGERCAAAALLLHGSDAEEVEAAHALALAAMPGEPRARRLAAMAFDRLRVLRGEPQKYGTQWTAAGDGLWPVEPATTDSERAKWGLPPLAELRRTRLLP